MANKCVMKKTANILLKKEFLQLLKQIIVEGNIDGVMICSYTDQMLIKMAYMNGKS